MTQEFYVFIKASPILTKLSCFSVVLTPHPRTRKILKCLFASFSLINYEPKLTLKLSVYLSLILEPTIRDMHSSNRIPPKLHNAEAAERLEYLKLDHP